MVQPTKDAANDKNQFQIKTSYMQQYKKNHQLQKTTDIETYQKSTSIYFKLSKKYLWHIDKSQQRI